MNENVEVTQEEEDATLRAFYTYTHYQYLCITSMLARLEDRLKIPWIDSKLPKRKKAAKERIKRQSNTM